MSETKLTRYRVCGDTELHDITSEYFMVNVGKPVVYLASDADARIAALERERDELRKRVEVLEPLKRRLCDAIPLLEEARDALPAISESSRILHKISPSLADRMDEVGNIDLWKKMDALRTPPAAQGAQP
jgi:hypothetical protein